MAARRPRWLPARDARRRRGLTLIEVMISVAIVVVMATIGWASLDGAIEMNDALARTDEVTRTARVAMGRLRRDLQTSFLSQNTQTQSYFTLFVAEDDDPDRLWFTSLSHQRLYRNTREADQAEISVWAERAPRDLGPGDILFHREAGRIDQYPDEGGRIWPLAYHVETFNLRFLDSTTGEWFDEWDSRKAEFNNRLPRAVQIGLVLLAPDPDDEERHVEVPFLTTVMLEYADPVANINGGTQ